MSIDLATVKKIFFFTPARPATTSKRVKVQYAAPNNPLAQQKILISLRPRTIGKPFAVKKKIPEPPPSISRRTSSPRRHSPNREKIAFSSDSARLNSADQHQQKILISLRPEQPHSHSDQTRTPLFTSPSHPQTLIFFFYKRFRRKIKPLYSDTKSNSS